jgi:tetratricopeptide (TPR) repeat protein
MTETTRSTGLRACHVRAGRPKGLHFLVLAVLCAPALAFAQAGPAAPRNLQVLPKDTSAQQVVAQMQQITRSLGVQCGYCHIEQSAPLLSVEELQAQQAAAAAAQAQQAQNPQPAQGQQAGRGRGRGRGPQGPQFDFAADDKRQKRTARVMLAMTNDINARLAMSLKKPAAEITRVQCATCHRGVTNPAQLSDVLRQTMLSKGEGAAVVQYRELRQQYLSSGAYDFREATLLDLGRESLAARKADDALAWLQLNAEFYPKSAPTYVELAKAHVAKRDRDSAIADLTKAVAIDPSNKGAALELARLKK